MTQNEHSGPGPAHAGIASTNSGGARRARHLRLVNPEPGPRIHVPAIGGAHHFAHLLPVACEIERREPGRVTVFAPPGAGAEQVRAYCRGLGGPVPEVVEMMLPGPLEALLPRALGKIARVVAWRRELAGGDLLLTAERTTTILDRLVPACPPIAHIPHGAGDRAVGFEKRFARFALVLAAGEKDRDRLVAARRLPEDRILATGPVKLAGALAAGTDRPRLFANDRPTILYNPHFSRKLGSFAAFAERLARAIAREGRYNLVIAPHVRLAATLSRLQRRAIEALAVPDCILVDLGSPASLDMTYTLGCDLYCGDVSSQVYEFLARPRPCLFVDAHGADWRDDPDYAMWHLGEVIAPQADPVAAIDRAFADHRAYLVHQRQRMSYVFSGLEWTLAGTARFAAGDPVARAAEAVIAAASSAARSPSRPVASPARPADHLIGQSG